MIVLSREEEQGIVIGDGLVVKILKIDGDDVQIGIENPKDLRITDGDGKVENPPDPRKT